MVYSMIERKQEMDDVKRLLKRNPIVGIVGARGFLGTLSTFKYFKRIKKDASLLLLNLL